MLPPATDPPLDPNDCILPGRTVLTYRASGRQCVRPIGKSWSGPVDKPIADTRLPILVRDEKFEDDQHLLPPEAEGLMEMRIGSTVVPGMTARDRLIGIGNGWDIIVTTLLLSHNKIAQRQTDTLDDTATAQQALVQLIDTYGPEYVSEFIQTLSAPAAEEAVSLLARHYVYQLEEEFSVVDSGSAKHLSKSTYVLESENRSALTGFDGSMLRMYSTYVANTPHCLCLHSSVEYQLRCARLVCYAGLLLRNYSLCELSLLRNSSTSRTRCFAPAARVTR